MLTDSLSLYDCTIRETPAPGPRSMLDALIIQEGDREAQTSQEEYRERRRYAIHEDAMDVIRVLRHALQNETLSTNAGIRRAAREVAVLITRNREDSRQRLSDLLEALLISGGSINESASKLANTLAKMGRGTSLSYVKRQRKISEPTARRILKLILDEIANMDNEPDPTRPNRPRRSQRLSALQANTRRAVIRSSGSGGVDSCALQTILSAIRSSTDLNEQSPTVAEIASLSATEMKLYIAFTALLSSLDVLEETDKDVIDLHRYRRHYEDAMDVICVLRHALQNETLSTNAGIRRAAREVAVLITRNREDSRQRLSDLLEALLISGGSINESASKLANTLAKMGRQMASRPSSRKSSEPTARRILKLILDEIANMDNEPDPTRPRRSQRLSALQANTRRVVIRSSGSGGVDSRALQTILSAIRSSTDLNEQSPTVAEIASLSATEMKLYIAFTALLSSLDVLEETDKDVIDLRKI